MCWKTFLNRFVVAYKNLTQNYQNNIHYEYIQELTVNLDSSFQQIKQINDRRDKLSKQRAAKLEVLSDKSLLDIHSSSGKILMLVRKSTDKIINVNYLFYRILEYCAQDVIGKSFTSVNIWFNNQDPIIIKDFLQNSKIIKQQIFQFRTKFGKIKNFLLSAEEIDIDGETLIFCMARDITNITQTSCCISYRCLNDQDWTMKFISSHCEKLTGYKVKDFIGNNTLPYADTIHKDDQKLVWDRVQEALKKQITYEILYRIKTKCGEIKWVWEKGQGVFSYNGKLLALEGLIEDVSELKKSEDELFQAREDLRKQIQLTIKGLQDTNSALKLAGEIPVLLNALNVETIPDIAVLAKLLIPEEITDNIEPELHLIIIALGKVAVTIQLYQAMTEPVMQQKTLLTAKQELEAISQQVNHLPPSLRVLISQIIIRWQSILKDVWNGN